MDHLLISAKIHVIKSGLKVVTVDVESPIVKCDLAFATEAFDDDGLPHTLEHLVFLGSEDYPYKGVLDLVANRLLSNGTNAYTDTDHTNYTVATAGSDGLLDLLPVYLDHLLYPTLTDSGYLTEVHHINGEGEDAGVVYCEMQATENTGETRCYREMLKGLYPGVCGYKSETGGIMKNLRESTSNTKVRDYHKKFYHAKNLCIVITGPVKAEDIFKSIKPIEDKIVLKGDDKLVHERPWSTPVQPLEKSSEKKIEYPCDTDDDGLVYIGFRGPSSTTNYRDLMALSVLLDYLNNNAVSPLQRDFVESDDAICCSVYHSIIENSTSCFYLSFDSVGKQHLDTVRQKLFDLLNKIVKGEEKFDMERMKNIISRKIVRILSVAETNPHTIVIGPIVGNFLYGTQDLKNRCQEIPLLKEFSNCDAQFWLNLLDKYMTGSDARYHCIVAQPSPSLMKSVADAEKERIAKQKEHIGDDLSKYADRLKQAIQENEKQAPEDLLNSFNVPSVDNIVFHSIERVVLEESLTPFRFQYDSVKTNFITIHALMDTSHVISKSDRLYLPLISEMILESSIMRDGNLVPYETIVSELFNDTVSTATSVGISSNSSFSAGSLSMLFSVVMQVEIEKYEKAVNWYKEILYNTVFTPERVKTTATRLVSEISQYKRSGGKVTSAIMNGQCYASNSNQWASNFMRQQKFLKNVLNKLKTDPKYVQEQITQVRDSITQPNNMAFHLTLDKNKIDVSKIHLPWLNIVPEHVSKSAPKGHLKYENVTVCKDVVQFLPEPKSTIVGVGSVESGYMYQWMKSIDSVKDPDLPALQVLLQYLTQLEGPLWRSIRGLGLSYHYFIQLNPSDGLIIFGLHKSTQLVAAYDKCLEIVDQYLKGKEDFEDNLFESAKSSLIFELIKKEKSAAGKSLQSMMAYFRDLDVDFNKQLIAKVSQVTKEDLRRVGQQYLEQLFKNEDRRSVICCHTSKVNEITESIQPKINNKLYKIELEKEEFLNSLE